MLFHEIDHGEWLPVFGIKLMVMRWILGNPLMAITMMRHDLTAGLRVPVELLLVENESGEGSTVIYALPSSLMVIEPNLARPPAARALDYDLDPPNRGKLTSSLVLPVRTSKEPGQNRQWGWNYHSSRAARSSRAQQEHLQLPLEPDDAKQFVDTRLL